MLALSQRSEVFDAKASHNCSKDEALSVPPSGISKHCTYVSAPKSPIRLRRRPQGGARLRQALFLAEGCRHACTRLRCINLACAGYLEELARFVYENLHCSQIF